MTDITTCY